MIELPGEISTLNLFGKLLGRIPGRKRDSPEKYFHVELLTPRTPARFLLNKTKIISWRKQVWLNLGDCFSTVIWQIILLFSLFMASVQFSSVQFSCSVVSDSLRPHELQHTRPPCVMIYLNPQSSFRLTSIESVMLSSHLILCRPLLLLPQIPPSISVLSNESTLCMRWPKYWQCRRPWFNSWIGNIPWRRDRLPISSILGLPWWLSW